MEQVLSFLLTDLRQEDRGHERSAEQVSLMRDGAAFSYKGIDNRVTKACGDELQCTSYYRHNSVGMRLLLDRAATHEAIAVSLATLFDSKKGVEITFI
jgi:hypothetical protein